MSFFFLGVVLYFVWWASSGIQGGLLRFGLSGFEKGNDGFLQIW